MQMTKNERSPSMKFSEMPYTRPNLEEIRKNSEAILQRLASAACA